MKVRKIDRHDGGTKTKSSKFYAIFTDHAGQLRRLPLFSDRKASDEAGGKIRKLVDIRAANDTIPEELSRFIETTLPSIRESLAKHGIIGTTKLAANKPLTGHVEEWKAGLIAKGNTAVHAKLVATRARKAFEACGFKYWNDISGSKLIAHLHEQRQDTEKRKGVSAQT